MLMYWLPHGRHCRTGPETAFYFTGLQSGGLVILSVFVSFAKRSVHEAHYEGTYGSSKRRDQEALGALRPKNTIAEASPKLGLNVGTVDGGYPAPV